MTRIIFNFLTLAGSVALLIACHTTGIGFVTSTIVADQTWQALLFTFGCATTVISLFFFGFEVAAFAHRKAPVVVNKYPEVTAKPILKDPDITPVD